MNRSISRDAGLHAPKTQYWTVVLVITVCFTIFYVQRENVSQLLSFDGSRKQKDLDLRGWNVSDIVEFQPNRAYLVKFDQ